VLSPPSGRVAFLPPYLNLGLFLEAFSLLTYQACPSLWLQISLLHVCFLSHALVLSDAQQLGSPPFTYTSEVLGFQRVPLGVAASWIATDRRVQLAVVLVL
jgi:hypothetical protein